MLTHNQWLFYLDVASNELAGSVTLYLTIECRRVCVYPIEDDTMHLMRCDTISISVLINIIISSIEYFWHIFRTKSIWIHAARRTSFIHLVSLTCSLTACLVIVSFNYHDSGCGLWHARTAKSKKPIECSRKLNQIVWTVARDECVKRSIIYDRMCLPMLMWDVAKPNEKPLIVI